MNQKIQKQVSLMNAATGFIAQIERLDQQASEIDPGYLGVKRKELAESYAYTMAQLVSQVTNDAGVKVIVHGYKTVVQIAEEVLS